MGNVAKYQHGWNMTFTVVELLMIIPKSTYLSISLPYFSIYHFFSLTLFGKNKMFQRGDFGGRIGIGLSIHSVYIGASYGGGFLNIAQEDDTSKFRNRSWSLSVGYDF